MCCQILKSVIRQLYGVAMTTSRRGTPMSTPTTAFAGRTVSRGTTFDAATLATLDAVESRSGEVLLG
jgi:hypothetical protein